MNENEGLPNNEQVRLVYKDTYNFYTKWIAVKEPDWDLVISESREIEARYPFDLCRIILVELIDIIEAHFMKKEEQHG